MLPNLRFLDTFGIRLLSANQQLRGNNTLTNICYLIFTN